MQPTQSSNCPSPLTAPAQPSQNVMTPAPPQPRLPYLDTDAEMTNIHEPTETPTHAPGICPPSTGFTIRIPSPMTYANALKRTTEQAGNCSPERPSSSDEQGDSEEIASIETNPRWPLGSPSGPIKGFCADHIMENLDPLVRSAWEKESQEVVFIHYMDGGYNPDIAHNVHAISEDLKSKSSPKQMKYRAQLTEHETEIYSNNYSGLDTIEPTVVHPTAATPMLYN